MLRQSDSDPASGPLQIVELAPQSAPQTLARHKKRGKEEEAKMVEVNAKGKPKGFSVDSCIGYTIYFAILVAVAVIALDALEYVSLGIVKDVLKMKVLSVEDFDALNADLTKVKTDLEAMTAEKDKAAADVTRLSGIEEQKATCDKAVTGLSQERDSLKTAAEETARKIAELETKVGGLEAELASAKAAAPAADAAAPAADAAAPAADATKEGGDEEAKGEETRVRQLRRR